MITFGLTIEPIQSTIQHPEYNGPFHSGQSFRATSCLSLLSTKSDVLPDLLSDQPVYQVPHRMADKRSSSMFPCHQFQQHLDDIALVEVEPASTIGWAASTITVVERTVWMMKIPISSGRVRYCSSTSSNEDLEMEICCTYLVCCGAQRLNMFMDIP